jgi:hypothetical protein
VAGDPHFWQLVLGLSLLCVLSGVVGLAWPDREPVLMDWSLVLGGFGVALFAGLRLLQMHGVAAALGHALALLLELVALLCLARSRFWQRRGRQPPPD